LEYATDSVMVNLLAEGAKEELEKSPLFDGYDIPIFNLSLFCNDSCPELYDVEYMASLSEQSQASLLLIIDDAATNLLQNNSAGKSVFSITYSALYRFYDVEQQRYIATRMLRDSLNFAKSLPWDLSAEDMQEIWRDVISEAGGQALGTTVPQWQMGYRFYYVPSVLSYVDWENAAYYADAGNWPEAMKIWGRLAEASTGKKAAYAAFNMALGAEMLTEYELALEWLALADESARLKETDGYRQRIRQRIADKEKLNEQLGY
jgi:hypothetical protein